jgi:hypothetical protein
MGGKIWHYLSNSILVCTTGSYRAMLLIANYTLAALNRPTDPIIYPLYNSLLPFVMAFLTAYSLWISQLGLQISKTSAFYLEITSLGETDIKIWDNAIQAIFMRGTTGYKALLAHGRKDFQSGSAEDKVTATEALSIALTGIVGLNAVKVLVDAKIILLNNTKTGKDSGISNTKINSDDVETKRITLAQELYGVLGNLMFHFRANPSLIIPFFNVTIIQKLGQTIWRRNMKSLGKEWLFTRTFVATDTIRLVNNSLNTLRFSMIATKTGVIGPMFYDIAPMSGITVPVLDFGPPANHNMVVQNLGAGTAKFMLVII